MDEEEQTNSSEQDKSDPLTSLINILKSALQENMKITKHSFEMLSDTHDEAKLLIDNMAETYRKLQVS